MEHLLSIKATCSTWTHQAMGMVFVMLSHHEDLLSLIFVGSPIFCYVISCRMGYTWTSPVSSFQSVRSKFVLFCCMYRPLLKLYLYCRICFQDSYRGISSWSQLCSLLWLEFKCFDPFLLNNFMLCWISMYSLFSRPLEVASLHTTDLEKFHYD